MSKRYLCSNAGRIDVNFMAKSKGGKTITKNPIFIGRYIMLDILLVRIEHIFERGWRCLQHDHSKTAELIVTYVRTITISLRKFIIFLREVFDKIKRTFKMGATLRDVLIEAQHWNILKMLPEFTKLTLMVRFPNRRKSKNLIHQTHVIVNFRNFDAYL